MAVVRIGLDIAKLVFQVHGVDGHGKTVLQKTLPRSQVLTYFAKLPVCLIGIEACASSHYWARELRRLGHDVRLMALHFVTPYRKSGKNDANDAEVQDHPSWFTIPGVQKGDGDQWRDATGEH